jgi:hypothetical protein
MVYLSLVGFFTSFWSLASGFWLLVNAYLLLAACLWISQEQEASSQKPDT